MRTRQRSVGMWSFILIVLTALVLSGCGAPADAPDAEPPAAEEATNTPESTESQDAPTATPQPTQPPAAPTPTEEPESTGPAEGGTVTIDFQEDPNSFDAALGYNLPAWQGLMNLYRGLMIYDGNRAVPDMADGMPEISDDGTVYTFKIKEGITFHNGREVTAEDFKYSLERVLDPDLASWASYYLLSLEGAQARLDGEADNVSGIEVVDDYTLRFTLTSPDMTFMNILALPNNWVVPREVVEEHGEEFGSNAVGTGPFMLESYTSGEEAVFVKNPDFFHEDQPHIDRVIMRFGVEPSTALLRMERGELDMLWGDMIPPADFSRLINDPQYEEWLFQEPSMYTWWLGLNNQVEPLDNLAVRQALNLAIDREKLAKLTGGKGNPLWGIYPSTAPGYQEGYKPYEYDIEAAKAKLEEAGMPDGFELELVIVDGPLSNTVAQAIQQDLAQIGVTVNIRKVSDTVSYDLMAEGETQSYLNSWYMIQPDPADLINNLYMCDAGSNFDYYCNPQMDELALQALAEQDREQRMEMYQEIERMLMEDAVHVPLFNNISYYMHNPRIKNFYSRSEYGPFLERIWVPEDQQQQ